MSVDEAVSRYQKKHLSRGNYVNEHLLKVFIQKVHWALQSPERIRWLLEELGLDTDEVADAAEMEEEVMRDVPI